MFSTQYIRTHVEMYVRKMHGPKTIQIGKDEIGKHFTDGSHLVLWERSSEKQNVWLWFVDHVVNPALTLLHPESPPLFFCHQVGGGHQFRQLLWKHDMPVLKLLVVVLVRIVNLFFRHLQWMITLKTDVQKLDFGCCEEAR